MCVCVCVCVSACVCVCRGEESILGGERESKIGDLISSLIILPSTIILVYSDTMIAVQLRAVIVVHSKVIIWDSPYHH